MKSENQKTEGIHEEMNIKKARYILSRISGAKVALDILLIAAMVTSCNVAVKDIAEAVKPKPEKVEAGAMTEVTIEERNFDSPKPVEYGVPTGNTSFKSYMDWECITNTASRQYKLQEECYTDCDGLRKHGDDYCVALGSYYADYIGERFRVTLDSGDSFTAVVGDFKADRHTDSVHRYTPMNDGGKNVIEFIVDTDELDSMARKMGDISFISGFKGNVSTIERIYE